MERKFIDFQEQIQVDRLEQISFVKHWLMVINKA